MTIGGATVVTSRGYILRCLMMVWLHKHVHIYENIAWTCLLVKTTLAGPEVNAAFIGHFDYKGL